jgi:hypothetical protein
MNAKIAVLAACAALGLVAPAAAQGDQGYVPPGSLSAPPSPPATPQPAPVPPPAPQSQPTFSGAWSSSEGDLSLVQQNGSLAGTYSKRGGRIMGQVDGAQAQGYWAQDLADQGCANTRFGTAYWGRFTWSLSPDGGHFDGQWSYCDADPTNPWNGDRKGD